MFVKLLLTCSIFLLCFAGNKVHAQDVYYEKGKVVLRHSGINIFNRTVWLKLKQDSANQQVVRLIPFLFYPDDSSIIYTVAPNQHFSPAPTPALTTEAAIAFRKKAFGKKKASYPVTWHTPADTTADPVPADSSSARHKKDPIQLKGLKIVSEGFSTSHTYTGQGLNNNYLRTTVYSQVNVFELPFTLSGLVTTENNSGLNQIDNFRISFDYQQFVNNLSKKTESEAAYQKMLELKAKSALRSRIEKYINDSFNTAINDSALSRKRQANYPDAKTISHYIDNIDLNIYELEKKTGGLQSRLNDPNYLADMERQKELLKNAGKDPGINEQMILNAQKKIREKEELDHDFRFYNGIRNLLTQYKKNAELEQVKSRYAGKKNFNTNGASGFWRTNLQAVKKLDLGTCSPFYTSLTIDGINLTGLNVEYNRGNFYTAFVGGVSNVNFNNPFDNRISGSRQLIAGRVGYGNVNKALLVFTLLKGDDYASNVVSDERSTYYQPSSNQVLAVQFLYKFEKGFSFDAEYARSHNAYSQTTTGGQSFTSSMGIILNNEVPYSAAYAARFLFEAPSGKTRISLQSRVVEPWYFSFGAPVLKNDNFRTEAKLDQKLYRQVLSMSSSVKYDRDNLYKLKPGTSVILSSVNSLTYRITNSMQLTGIYSPIIQSYFLNDPATQLTAYINLASAVLSHSAAYKNIGNYATGSVTRIWSKQVASEDTYSSKINQYNFSFNDVFTFRKQEISILLNTQYITQGHSLDSGNLFVSTLGVTYKVWRKYVTLSHAATYQDDQHRESRQMVTNSVGITLRKFSINLSSDIQQVKRIYTNVEFLNLTFRIRAIYSIR